MKIIIAMLFLFLNSMALAQVVSDPNGILSQLDTYLNHPDFDSSFEQPFEYHLKQVDCMGARICDEANYSVLVTRKNTKSSEVYAEVLKQSRASKNKNSVRIAKALWDNHWGNTLRIKIQSMNSFGFSVELNSISDDVVPVSINGKLQQLNVKTVEMNAVNSIKQKISLKLSFSNELPGTTQLVFEEERKSGIMSGQKTETIDDIRCQHKDFLLCND